MNRRWLPAFIIVYLVAPTNGRAQTASRAVAGCYELTVGEWSPADPNPAYHRIPRLIRLDTVPNTQSRRGMLAPSIAYPYHSAMPGTPNWNLAGDTLRLLWSNGFQVTVVTLEGGDSLWTGEAAALSDAVPADSEIPRTRVTARRTSCR